MNYCNQITTKYFEMLTALKISKEEDTFICITEEAKEPNVLLSLFPTGLAGKKDISANFQQLEKQNISLNDGFKIIGYKETLARFIGSLNGISLGNCWAILENPYLRPVFNPAGHEILFLISEH